MSNFFYIINLLLVVAMEITNYWLFCQRPMKACDFGAIFQIFGCFSSRTYKRHGFLVSRKDHHALDRFYWSNCGSRSILFHQKTEDLFQRGKF